MTTPLLTDDRPDDALSVTLSDLRDRAEKEERLEVLDDYLSTVLDTVAERHVEPLGVDSVPIPSVGYIPLKSGASFNPKTNQLTVRLPRDPPVPGAEYLRLNGQSIATVLAGGLVAASNQRLVEQYFESNYRATAHIHHQESQTLLPGVDSAFSATVAFHLEATVPDPDRWNKFVAARTEWYSDQGTVNPRRFEAVIRTIGTRIQNHDGEAVDRVRQGLAIREQLIADGDVSVIDPE